MTIQQGAVLNTQGFGNRAENVEVPVVDFRAPAPSDVNYPIGKLWVDSTANTTYNLTSFSTVGGTLTATWASTGTASGALVSLTTQDSAVVVPSLGTIDIDGAAGQMTTTGAGNVVTINFDTSATFPGSVTTTTSLTVGTTLHVIGASTLAALTEVGTCNINATGTAVTTIGSLTSGATNLKSGGTLTLDVAAAQNVTIAPSQTGGTMNIGGTGANVGTMTIAGGTGGQTVNIAASTGGKTVHIANGAGVNTVTLGSASSTSATTINSGSGVLNLTSASGNIGITTGGGTIDIDSDVGTIGISTDAAATALNIGTGGAVKTIIIGSTNTTSNTTLQCGSSGQIDLIGEVDVTGNVNLAAAGNKLSIHASTAASDAVGIATLGAGGTVIVSTTAVTANSLIFLTYNNCTSALAAALDAPSASIIPNTSFVINSQDATDATSTVNYWIIN